MIDPLSSVPFEQWQPLLQDFIAAHCKLVRNATTVRETTSTQDEARKQRCIAGDVITAWRQTAGRGRLGRVWVDTTDLGIAVTFVVPRDQPERLAIASAIGIARAAESILGRPVGIKWPNDIVVHNRKLAGILIEQFDDVALIGVGMNVHQTNWPDELASRAISLLQLGVEIDRLAVIQNIVRSLDAALQLDESALVREFTSRDVLCGTTATFRVGHSTATGRVLRIDPLHGLALQVNGSEVWLRAAITSLRDS